MRNECDSSEYIIRAIREADYDKEKNRYSSTLMRGPNTSVSRISILSINKLWKIFRREVHKPDNSLMGAGIIKIQSLKTIAQQYKNGPRELTVVIAPSKTNPGHAEIKTTSNGEVDLKQKQISKGLALELGRRLCKISTRKCSWIPSLRECYIRSCIKWQKTLPD